VLQYLKNKFGSENRRRVAINLLRKMDDQDVRQALIREQLRKIVEDDVGLVSRRPTLPRGADALLGLFLTKSDRSVIPADLEEEFRTKILPRLGASRARRWYWRQTALTILHRNPLSLQLLTGRKIGARANER
jgi:hypothetical protein